MYILTLLIAHTGAWAQSDVKFKDSVCITSLRWFLVYPRVIYYIHRVAEGYNRKLYKTIACVTCRYVISNHADGFPVSSIIFIGVFPQVDIELYGGALFRTVSRRHFFVFKHVLAVISF